MTAQPVTLYQLAAQRELTVADLPEDTIGRTELIDGSLYVTPLGDIEHQAMSMNIAGRLQALVGLRGLALAGVNVILSDGTLIIPDVAVIDPDLSVHNGLGVSPEGLLLAVEITSPSTRRRDLTVKRDLYREASLPLVIIDRSKQPYAASISGELPDWARREFKRGWRYQ